jgi:hypothetical protein
VTPDQRLAISETIRLGSLLFLFASSVVIGPSVVLGVNLMMSQKLPSAKALVRPGFVRSSWTATTVQCAAQELPVCAGNVTVGIVRLHREDHRMVGQPAAQGTA